MASTRSRVKASVASQIEPSQLNTRERLIFSQAVHEFGSDAWVEISKLLSKHPLISRPKGTFNPQSCRVIYLHLMQEAGLDSSEAIGPKSPLHLKLAQHHYADRVKELRQLIAAEEAKFKTLATEIDEIRNGLWDNKFVADSTIEQAASVREPSNGISATPPGAVDQDASPHDEVNSVTDSVEAEAEVLENQEHIDDTHDDDDEGNPPETVVQDDATPLIDTTSPEVTEPQEVTTGFAEQRVDSPADHHEEKLEHEPEPEYEHELDASVPQDNDADLTLDKEEPEEDSNTALAEDDPMAPDPAEQDEMAVVEETTAVETEEIDPGPSTPTDTDRRADGKRKASELETPLAEAPRERKRARDESEPIDDEEPGPATAGRPRRRLTGGDPQPVSKRFQNVISLLHATISAHRYGNIFHNPIKKSEAPDYHDIVKRPMDLKTIKARIKDGLISNSLEFQRDVYLMFANAMMYNRPGSDIYAMTEEMMLASENHIQTFRHTEGFHRA